MSIAPAGAGGQKEAGVPADKKWAPHCGAHWESDRVSVLSHPVCQTVRTQQDRRIYPFGNISWREFPEEIIRFGQKFQILDREFRAATGAFFHNSILFHRNCLLSCVFCSLFFCQCRVFNPVENVSGSLRNDSPGRSCFVAWIYAKMLKKSEKNEIFLKFVYFYKSRKMFLWFLHNFAMPFQ